MIKVALEEKETPHCRGKMLSEAMTAERTGLCCMVLLLDEVSRACAWRFVPWLLIKEKKPPGKEEENIMLSLFC